LQKPNIIYRLVFIIPSIFLLLIFCNSLSAQVTNQTGVKTKQSKVINPYPSHKSKEFFEIDKITFTGNKAFSSDELSGVIYSKASNRSLPHKIIQYYYDHLIGNKGFKELIPNIYPQETKELLSTMESELRYYDKTKAENDVQALIDYYHQNGYHNVFADYSFYGDTVTGHNYLAFKIIENKQYRISSINYFGLDSLPPDIYLQVKDQMRTKPGVLYNETAIMRDISAIQKLLLDNGYFYAIFELH
jgi:outer membrane protein assembly factor BamA